MTAIEYEQITGQKPIDDDLDRVNCEKVGLLGHWSCGWCPEHNKPRFVCNCIVKSFINHGHTVKDMITHTEEDKEVMNEDDRKRKLIQYYINTAAAHTQIADKDVSQKQYDQKKTLLEFYAGRSAKEIINVDDLQDMISIVMDMADTTSDRGLKRYLFNAIDHLGAAHLYLQKYPASAKLSEYWQKHPFNDEMKRV